MWNDFFLIFLISIYIDNFLNFMKYFLGSLDVWYMKKLEILRNILLGVKFYNFYLSYINFLSEILVYEGIYGFVDWVFIFLYVYVFFRLV